MIEEITKSVLTTLISQGGGWLIAVLLILVVIYQARKLDKAQESCDLEHAAAEKEVRAQFEKRLEEHKALMDALNRSSGALNTMQVSVDARTEAINSLVAGFATLVRDMEGQRERWADRVKRIDGALEDLRGRIEDLQRRMP